MGATGIIKTKNVETFRARRLARNAAMMAWSLLVMAHGTAFAADDMTGVCTPAFSLHQGHVIMLPSLPGVQLSEAQDDEIFAVIHAQMPVEREIAKEVFKALQEFRRLMGSDRVDTEKARAIAETSHARAMGRLADMRAELEAKVGAILTPEQRKQMDDNCPRLF